MIKVIIYIYIYCPPLQGAQLAPLFVIRRKCIAFLLLH